MSMPSIDILNESDLYTILGVNPDTDIADINKKYKSLAKQYHPDTVTDPIQKEKVSRIFSKITSSYNILKDSEKRKAYDYERKLKEEYQKTLNSTQFNFPKRNESNGGITINITNVNNQNKGQPQKGTPASQETKNEQAEKLYNSAMEKYQAGNVDAAILDLQTAIVLSKVAKYHSCLGLFMNEKGWSAYAQSHFKTALNIDPKDKLALKHLNPVTPDNAKASDKINDKANTSKKQQNITKNKISALEFIKNIFTKFFTKRSQVK